MTQVYDAQNVLVPVTVVEAGPCAVVQVKTVETDGYNAVQIGFSSKKAKNSSKAELAHAKKAASTTPPRPLRGPPRRRPRPSRSATSSPSPPSRRASWST
jgi:large subunit ribosomal protein L3